MNNENDIIDLHELYNDIKSKKRYILYYTAFLSILTIIYCLITTPIYTSYVSIYPIIDDSKINSSMGDLQGLVSSFGINLGNQTSTSFYIPDIVKSRKLRKTLLLNKWNINDDNRKNLISYWRIDDTTDVSITKNIKNLIFGDENKDFNRYYLETAIEIIDDRIKIIEEESGLITITVEMEEPQLASDIANYISEYIIFYISTEMNVQNKKYRKFIEGRLESSKNELKLVEESLTEFRKNNPIALDTPDLQLYRARLIRDVETKQGIYLTLLTQHELAKIEELKETPIINILDVAEPSIEPIWPKKKILLILSIIFGIISSLIILSFKYFLKNN